MTNRSAQTTQHPSAAPSDVPSARRIPQSEDGALTAFLPADHKECDHHTSPVGGDLLDSTGRSADGTHSEAAGAVDHLTPDHRSCEDHTNSVGGQPLTTLGQLPSDTRSQLAGYGDPSPTADHHPAEAPTAPVVGGTTLLPPEPAPSATLPAEGQPDGWKELRIWAEMFEDAQKARIACTNRAERSGLDPAIYTPQLDAMKAAEHTVKLAMVRHYRRVVAGPIREWQQATPGIGEHLLARLLGIIGHPVHAEPHHWEGEGANRVLIADLPFDRNIAKLWAYCGHGDPTRKRAKGMTAEQAFSLGNPRAKMVVHLLSEACMKQRTSPYRIVYDHARNIYEQREGWTPGHQHAAALRKVGKEVLRDLWIVAKTT